MAFGLGGKAMSRGLKGLLSAAAMAFSGLAALAFVWLWLLNLDTSAVLAFGNKAAPLVLTLSGLIFAAVGWLITTRRPGNKVGWIAAGIGFSAAISTMGTQYAIYATLTDPGSLPGWQVAAWLGNSIWVLAVGLLASILVLVYPDGHLPTRRWRGVMIVAIVGMATAVMYFTVAPGPLESLQWIENPFGFESSRPWIEFLSLGFFALALTVPAAVWSMRRRYLRSDLVARAQIRWFAVASTLVAVSYIGQFIYSVLTDTLDGGSEAQRWFQTVAIGGFGAMGAAVGIAILRYRLYDIDRIISRTVTYAMVVGLIGLVVLAVVSVSALVLPSDDPLVVAMATLVVFVLFNPLRRRVQEVVDRRFNRSRYDAARVIDDITGTLRDRVDQGDVINEWVGVVETTMRPTSIGVWVRET